MKLPPIGRTVTCIAAGVAVATLSVWCMWNIQSSDSIDAFARAYSAADSTDQVAIAEDYLRSFSAPTLLRAIEEHNDGRLCHVQGHAFGRALYKRTGDFSESIRACGNACTYGCFHGAIMEMFATDSDTLGGAVDKESPEDFVTEVQRLAPDLCSRPDVESVVPYRFCTHGVGHMFAYIERDDVAAAIRDCEVMPDRLALSACITGVFMEHMFDPAYVADTLTTTEAPCDRFPGNAEPCLRYKAYGWITVWGTTAQALKACESMGADALLCARGVGEATSSPAQRSTAAGFQAMCGGASEAMFKACVVGALLKLVDVNDGDDSEHMCDAVAPEYRHACVLVTRDSLTKAAQAKANVFVRH